jgi:hypothetical protein
MAVWGRIIQYMKFIRTSLLAIVVLVGVLAFAGTSGASSLKNCGGGVRAAQVACDKAKRIVVEYKKTHQRQLQGYTCKSGSSQGRCALDNKLVLFSLN